MIKENGTTFLTDKGFGIENFCHSKGLLHNRPPLKFDSQESDKSKNFDVATLRIYDNNYIGRMRGWSTTFSDVFTRFLAHIVNMLFALTSSKGTATTRLSSAIPILHLITNSKLPPNAKCTCTNRRKCCAPFGCRISLWTKVLYILETAEIV